VADPALLARGRKGRALRSDLALIAHLGYTMEEGGTSADWDLFRDHMVIPYVQERFGDEAWVPPEGYLRAVRSRARLLFALRDGRRVSGACLVVGGRRVWTPLLGVLDGDARLLQEGALAALYKFLLEWASDRGAETVDIGRTRPSLSDGIAWYKSKWGFTPVPDPLAHLVAVRLGPGTSPIRDRLQSRRILIQYEDDVRPLTTFEAPPTSTSAAAALAGTQEG
jgi:hypothetical protein